MANHKSAIKRHRQSLERAARNRSARTRVKHAVKDVQAAIKSKDKTAADDSLRVAASILAKAAGKGAIHKRKASRKMSRMARSVNAMAAS
ncbi:MAG: 30S ribosomal protein S20 [Desulfovibrio sp.]|nr:30S ribosomal protein S20 [Desulfovibrio sp.]